MGRANYEARTDVSEETGLSADPANRRRRRSIRNEHDEELCANLALHPIRAGAIVRAHG